ncbi:ROK family protein [Kineococcus sp. NUM-3379]
MDGAGSGWTAGLDLGGTKVLGVLLDAEASVRGTVRAATRPGPEGVVSTVVQAVERLCADAGREPASLTAVGVGLPGLVDPLAGSVSHAVNLGLHEEGFPLAGLLARRLGGVPVLLENDLNAAALGATRVLRLPGDLAFLALGTGVAAGLVLDGRVRRGARGAAGEVGHLPYRPGGARCACGQRGCLELYASGTALDAAWPSRQGRPAPAEVFDAAAAGDPVAVGLRDGYADAVAAAVRILVLTCDVEHVVLGGGVAQVGAPLLEAVRAAVRAQSGSSPFLRSLGIAERVRLAPPAVPLAPVGAALAAGAGAGRPEPEVTATW